MAKSQNSFRERLYFYVTQVMKGRHTDLLSHIIKNGLWVLSLLFGGISKIRSWMYDYKYLPSYTSSAPIVISVGNIVAGGAGKTPVVLLLAEELTRHSKVAILSRGYHSPIERQSVPLVLSKGFGPLFSAAECGDEPYLLSKRAPNAIVIVGKNRIKAAEMAVQAGAKILLIDDGFQHRRLQRNYDIVVMNSNDLFGHGHYLPRGFLRESPQALKRADLIILNHVQNEKHAYDLIPQLRHYTDAPVVGTKMHVKALHGAETILGMNVGLFCAIAHPESFIRSIENMGATICSKWILPDHSEIEEVRLKAFITECRSKGAKSLVCTEKDQVKLEKYRELDLPIIWLQMDLMIVAGLDHWKNFMDKVKEAY